MPLVLERLHHRWQSPQLLIYDVSQARGGPDQIVAASDHGAARRTGADHSCGDQMPRTSAGLLPYRRRDGRLEVFLVHPGGPFWAGKDAHAWSVAKGEVEQDEDLLHAAHREFAEETGLTLAGSATPLAPVRQSAGKIVHVWAIETEIDPTAIQSNSFPLEWPPRSGQVRQFPEVDRAAWFDLAEARSKIHKGQVALLDETKSKLGG